jgi:hypothetical protein
MTKLLTDRIKKTPPNKVSAERYKFIRLSEVEPDLGTAPFSNGILSSNTQGARSWLKTGNGLAIQSTDIVVVENTVPIDSALLLNSNSSNLKAVLSDLDIAITDAATVAANALTVVTSDNSLSGDGRISTPLSVVKWASPINITLTGDVSGTASVDGSANVSMQVNTNLPTISAIVSITKSLTITDEWQDVGISGDDLETGSYVIQLFANDTGAGGSNNNEYYTGMMSWFSGQTTQSLELPNDEIVLHRAGGGSDAGLYLRTMRASVLKLQIYTNVVNQSASNYVFKFRKII